MITWYFLFIGDYGSKNCVPLILSALILYNVDEVINGLFVFPSIFMAHHNGSFNGLLILVFNCRLTIVNDHLCLPEVYNFLLQMTCSLLKLKILIAGKHFLNHTWTIYSMLIVWFMFIIFVDQLI